MKLTITGWIAKAAPAALLAVAIGAGSAGAQSRAVKNCYEGIGCPWRYEIKAEDLDKISCQSLAFMRNRIYFENGLCFRTAKVKQEFGNEGCKTASVARVKLNRFEQANVAAIRKAEARKKCPP